MKAQMTYLRLHQLLGRREVALADTADGAHPVFGDVFEGSTGLDAAVGIAGFGVVDVTAYVAYILFHKLLV